MSELTDIDQCSTYYFVTTSLEVYGVHETCNENVS